MHIHKYKWIFDACQIHGSVRPILLFAFDPRRTDNNPIEMGGKKQYSERLYNLLFIRGYFILKRTVLFLRFFQKFYKSCLFAYLKPSALSFGFHLHSLGVFFNTLPCAQVNLLSMRALVTLCFKSKGRRKKKQVT